MDTRKNYRRRVLQGGKTALANLMFMGVLISKLSGAEVAPPENLTSAIETYQLAMDTKDPNERLQRFSQAAQLFQQSLDQQSSDAHSLDGQSVQAPHGFPSADLYVNLGNAYLQAQETGAAILAYRRALKIAPSHLHAQQNLKYARATLPAWIQKETEHEFVDTFLFWQTLFPRATLDLFASLCFLLAASLMALGIVRQSSLAKTLACLPTLLWVLVASTLWLGQYQSEDEAVLIGNQSILRTADSENSKPRLTSPIPNGAEVTIVEDRGRWSEILVAGESGWVLSASLARIAEMPSTTHPQRGPQPKSRPSS